jgi:hypothetical protein
LPESVRDGCMIGCLRRSGNGCRKNYASESRDRNNSIASRQCMRVEFKFVAGLLTLVFAVAPIMTALPFESPTKVPASGCHHSDHRTPAPKSSDYSCCKSGHSTALLQSSCAAEIGCLQSDMMVMASAILSASPNHTDLIFPFEHPPGLVPLRV